MHLGSDDPEGWTEPRDGLREEAAHDDSRLAELTAVAAVLDGRDDVRVLYVLPDDDAMLEDWGRTVVRESLARVTWEFLMDSRERRHAEFTIVVVALECGPRLEFDLRRRCQSAERFVAVTATACTLADGWQERLRTLVAEGAGFLEVADPAAGEGETWAGDGIDESLLDLLETDMEAVVIVEGLATSVGKTRALHPDRCLCVDRVRETDLARATGLALSGARTVLIVSWATAGNHSRSRELVACRRAGAEIVVVVSSGMDPASCGLHSTDPAPKVVPSSELSNALAETTDGGRTIVAVREGHRARRSDPSDDVRYRAEHAAIRSRALSVEFTEWVERYAQIGGRPRFLWKWADHCLEFVTLDSVPNRLRPFVADTKLLGVMVNALWDDLADNEGDRETLQVVVGHAVGTFGGPVPSHRAEYVAFCRAVWIEYQRRIATLPRFERFAELLDLDHRHLVTTMHYSMLLKDDVSLLTAVEHDAYTPHNMMMTVFWTIDMMCSDAVDERELTDLRDVYWHGQCMGRIGNVLGTWEREVREGDYANSVFSRAASHGILHLNELSAMSSEDIIGRIHESGVEDELVADWRAHRSRVLSLATRIQSVDIRSLVRGLDRLLDTEIASRGHK